MEYRTEATTIEGFIQQLAANYLPHGYWFYVSGQVPIEKNPALVDRKLVMKYGIAISRQQRARRKHAGLANLHYLRYGRTWVLLATKGEHAFFAEEAGGIRDLRKVPLQVGGYSLSVRQGGFLKKQASDEPAVADSKRRVRVQIARERYRDLKGYFLELATRRSAEDLGREFFVVPFEPYAPIRRQLLNLLRLVNAKRQAAGCAKIPPTVLRYQRRIVKPFELVDHAAAIVESERIQPTARRLPRTCLRA